MSLGMDLTGSHDLSDPADLYCCQSYVPLGNQDVQGKVCIKLDLLEETLKIWGGGTPQ